MLIEMMVGKIHKATITEANLNYVGSITIDSVLMKAAGIYPNQKVQIVNNNNGVRMETYVIEGEEDSGTICINGAAARLVQPGDIVIIIAYGMLDETEIPTHQPKVVFVDNNNKIISLGKESEKDNKQKN